MSKVRKPRPFKIDGMDMCWFVRPKGKWQVFLATVRDPLTPAQLRRMAAWLTQAAAWIEQQEKQDGR